MISADVTQPIDQMLASTIRGLEQLHAALERDEVPSREHLVGEVRDALQCIADGETFVGVEVLRTAIGMSEAEWKLMRFDEKKQTTAAAS